MRLAPGYHFYDDVAPGAWWETGRRVVTAADIDGFAALSGDRFAIHMEDAAARAMGFPGRVAHGLLILSLIDGLKNAAPVQMRAVASLGWDWRFSAPVLIGDEIGARIEVVGARATRDPGRGTLHLRFEVDTRGTLVQGGENRLMVLRDR